MHSLRNKSSFSKDKNWVYRQESDICMLHLFESFMGAAPQLILQLYIIAILNYAPLWTSKCSLHHSYKYVIKCLILYFTYRYIYADMCLNVNIKVRCNYKGFKINIRVYLVIIHIFNRYFNKQNVFSEKSEKNEKNLNFCVTSHLKQSFHEDSTFLRLYVTHKLKAACINIIDKYTNSIKQTNS